MTRHLASRHFTGETARATTPQGTCTAAEGLDAETFRSFQLAGELFLLTSFFIEPEEDRIFPPRCGETGVIVMKWK
jgi:hypothetical protein